MQHGSEKELIESIYKVTIDPTQYDALLQVWENEFTEIPDDLEIKNIDEIDFRPGYADQAIENHFYRALSILDLVDSKLEPIPTVQDMVQADPLPTFLLAENKTIMLANDACAAYFGIKFGQVLADIGLENKDIDKINELLLGLEYVKTGTVLCVVQLNSHLAAEQISLVVSKIEDKPVKKNYLQFSTIQMAWNDDVGQTIKANFDLSNAELEIAKRLISGEKLSDIAIAKNRSINTIRTQSKSLFRKTNLGSQSQLIRLFAALQHFDGSELDYVAKYSDKLQTNRQYKKQDHYLTRADGRKVYYEIHGDLGGRPVLFLHGIMTGTKLPQKTKLLLKQQNIKLICPHRPGFGYSDVNSCDHKLENFADDMRALLDQEQIDKCLVMGHQSGAYYAYSLGGRIADRVSGIRIVNGGIPHISAKQISEISPRHRIFAYTTIYTPKLLPFILRVGMTNIQKNGAEGILAAMYKNSEFDKVSATDPEIRDILINGFHSSIAHGIESVFNDLKCVCSGDWGHLIVDCLPPVEIYHGRQEHVVPIGQVRALVAQYSKLKLVEVEGAQTMFYRCPEIIFENL